MDAFWKAAAAVLLTVILSLAVGKQDKQWTILLSISACCLTGIITLAYLEPVMDMLRNIEAAAGFPKDYLGILLKCTGLALTAELGGMICSDAGLGSLEKALHLLGSSAILYSSVPVFNSLLTLLQEILGKL